MDAVNPDHYKGEIEAIDAIKASMTQDQFNGYLKGNSIKYLWRWEKKGKVTDLYKCKWYIERLILEANLPK